MNTLEFVNEHKTSCANVKCLPTSTNTAMHNCKNSFTRKKESNNTFHVKNGKLFIYKIR